MAEQKRESRKRLKTQLFPQTTVGKARRIITKLLDSEKIEDRRFAAVFVLEQMYGKAAAKPLDKPANPKDDKLAKLIGQVMTNKTVNETNADPAKPN